MRYHLIHILVCIFLPGAISAVSAQAVLEDFLPAVHGSEAGQIQAEFQNFGNVRPAYSPGIHFLNQPVSAPRPFYNTPSPFYNEELHSRLGLQKARGVSSVSLETGDGQGWWTRKYLVDYALIVGGTAGYIIGEDIPARKRARIGPSFDPNQPADIFESNKFSEPYREHGEGETVPEYWIHRSIAGVAVLLAGLEAREWKGGRGSGHAFHNTVVGYAETVALTATATSMSKPFFSRLRPDFTERALRYYCPQEAPAAIDPYCDSYRDNPLAGDAEEADELFDDGRRSFISGHSSHSFNLFGYAALAVGGRYVWGDNTSARSRRAGIAGQAALVSAAAFITISRVTDGRHHLSDVVVGSLVGAGIANFSYWTRFDRRGNPRLRAGGRSDSRANRESNRAHSPQNGMAAGSVRTVELADISVIPRLNPDGRTAGLQARLLFQLNR